MAITASTYTLDAHTQVDGRRYVRETHVDSAGGEHVIEYLAEAGADYTAIMNARAVQLAESLAVQEFSELLDGTEP